MGRDVGPRGWKQLGWNEVKCLEGNGQYALPALSLDSGGRYDWMHGWVLWAGE